ncbi:D-alanine--D-alanine ligase [Flavobacterium sp. IB48]|uniref:D-alanine--D-alanine ligase n=1 Tax=Flavobacterium sp. IB48 TaxID=2779375 RepID=UPI0018E89E1E|nr:D-alanine--D-alanine ligase [Flavobacterium sp. IB48]MBJ2126377.1 D-alanine--D-alanine ligase [Flavobacterium sp. IB48]
MKTKIALVFGGKSAEHQVSLNSATNIFNAINKNKFEVILLGVDKKGRWKFQTNYQNADVNLTREDYFKNSIPVFIDNVDDKLLIVDKNNIEVLETFDVVFSIIHGTFGEDGTLQGFFKSLNIPFVGPDILGSAICMDKDVTKRLLRDNNIPIADFVTLNKVESAKIDFEAIKEKLGLPMFVKPSNAGSSVGVNKVIDKVTFEAAVKEAFKFDNKILVEEAILGKEVECAILGNQEPKSSVIGEIIPTKDFYSYDAKYQDVDGAKTKIPADISVQISEKLRETALKAFATVCCEGIARVDFFLRDDNTFVLNEINTLPGFTEISMYPKLWAQTGISYPDLISKIIEFSLERHERDNKLQTIK